MSEKPTRKRTKGERGMEELRENALKLQQALGQIPKSDEILADMMCALATDLFKKAPKKMDR